MYAYLEYYKYSLNCVSFLKNNPRNGRPTIAFKVKVFIVFFLHFVFAANNRSFATRPFSKHWNLSASNYSKLNFRKRYLGSRFLGSIVLPSVGFSGVEKHQPVSPFRLFGGSERDEAMTRQLRVNEFLSPPTVENVDAEFPIEYLTWLPFADIYAKIA